MSENMDWDMENATLGPIFTFWNVNGRTEGLELVDGPVCYLSLHGRS